MDRYDFTQQDAPVPIPELGQPSEGSKGGEVAGSFDPKLINMDKPWDGDTPRVTLPGADSDVKFERRPDGVWCRKRGKGVYPVDRNGEQWSKPHPYKQDGSLNYDRKPPEINSSIWWGKYNQHDRKKCWTKFEVR